MIKPFSPFSHLALRRSRILWTGLAALLWAAALSGCGPRPAASSAPLAPASNDKRGLGTAPAPVKPAIRFVDVTKGAGIQWVHYSGARGKKYMPEIEPPGCAFLDYNNDGRHDILLLNGRDWPEVKTGRKPARLALYRNEGEGRFTDVTKEAGLAIEMYTMGVAVGDYNNDGYSDLYITCVLEPSRLFRNDGKGRFIDVTKEAGVDNGGQWGTSAAWVDYDRDGQLDLAVGNFCKWTPKTDIHCSVYQGKKSYCTPSVYDGVSARLYRNLGNGRFLDVTEKAGLINRPGKTWGVMILDFDDDGWPDIALANDMEPNCLFRNQGDGTFKESGLMSGFALSDNGTAKAGMGIDAGDVDNSGYPSVMVSNFTGEGLSLFQNQRDGLFLEASHAWRIGDVSLLRMGWGLNFLDYDLDGRLDALVVNGHLYENVQSFQPDVTFKEPPLLLHNQGTHFVNRAADHGPDLPRPMVARGSAFADMDGDGDLDLLIMENNGKPRLLRNDGGSASRWLRVRTVGTRSNRDGIGAKVVAESGGVRQTRWVKSTSGFMSCSEMTVTFGLGQTTKVDRLTITWPSGQKDVYTNLPTNQMMTMKEGASSV